MLVIIPHPDDALKITKFQNALIGHLAKFNLTYYKKPPLWFSLPELLAESLPENLKNIKVTSVIMEEPYVKEGKILSNITMQVNNQQIKSEFTLLYPWNNKETQPAFFSTPESLLNQALSQNKKILNFPKAFRIFRLGIAERLSENSMALSESLWVKLR